MYAKMLLAGTLVWVCATAAAPPEDVAPETVDPQTSPVGRTIADFELHDHLGTAHKLSEWGDRKAVVIAFLGVECPLAKLYGPRLEELAKKYRQQGVAFVAINANQQDSLPEIAHYVREHKLEFPVLKDPGNKIADQFGATRTPEVLLLDAERRVRYWGRIDDQYGVGYVRNAATSHDLKTAIDELLAGKEITHPAREPVGCFIGKVRRAEPQGTITYTEHVASILHKHCVRCHRPGEVAPFSLTSYEDVQSWAETIDEVVGAGRMPPWHADPKHGHFWNDARLPDEAKETLRTWIRNGCPQGDLAKLPKLPEFTAGWQISTPDVVYKMPQPYAVPAKGVVEYQHFSIDPGFKEDVWVKAAEARPGNRTVTHHLIAFFHPPGSDEWEPLAPLSNSIAGFAPGMPPAIYPKGAYRRIPAGSKIVIQAHYTPNGTAQTDQSEVGIVFAKPEEIKREFSVAAVLNFRFLIPPGAANHEVTATHKFDEDSVLYSLTPHMHLRGKSFEYVAAYPDGREETLLSVPRYDFNWQNTYALAEPKKMPQGTEIRCRAIFDNSADNLANPNPRLPVMWGDQTWQEMMVGTLGISPQHQDFSVGMPVVKPAADGKFDVTFRFLPPAGAKKVSLAGTFNEWNVDEQPMKGPDADGRYETTLPLAAGTHEYKFVVDGDQWFTDPGNPARVGFYRNSELRILEKAEAP
jgi:peroxiredoxin